MNEAEFDKFADQYYVDHAAGIAVSGEDPEYFSEYKIKDIARELSKPSNSEDQQSNILDFGAGIGNSIPYVHKHISKAKLTCLDLSQRSLEIAQRRFGKVASYVHFDAATIPFPANTFDTAYAMCVFHHIPHSDHASMLQELYRVIRPGGNLFIFEHNPYNPLTVRVVNNCPFDENAHLIRGSEMKKRVTQAGFSTAKIRYRIFFPKFLRSLRPLEGGLTWLPLGGQYYIHARK